MGQKYRIIKYNRGLSYHLTNRDGICAFKMKLFYIVFIMYVYWYLYLFRFLPFLSDDCRNAFNKLHQIRKEKTILYADENDNNSNYNIKATSYFVYSPHILSLFVKICLFSYCTKIVFFFFILCIHSSNSLSLKGFGFRLNRG